MPADCFIQLFNEAAQTGNSLQVILKLLHTGTVNRN